MANKVVIIELDEGVAERIGGMEVAFYSPKIVLT